MNAIETKQELELVAYELAEAERLERKAAALCLKAVKRTAKIHAYFKAGIDSVLKKEV